ncbi:MAG: SOS response-associated peptidase [Maritimibacter sp.]
MCGRLVGGNLTQTQMLAIIEGFVYGKSTATEQGTPDLPPRWNIKPTDPVNMAFLKGETIIGAVARWWFVPHWFQKPAKEWKATTFNAKIETAAEKPTFREAWQSARCVIPALGYYEWSGPKSKRQPWFIGVESNQPAAFFAGLYATDAEGHHSCTILTRPALPQLAHIHPRSPIILTEQEIAGWMTHDIQNPEAAETLGTGWNDRCCFHPVASFGRDDEGPELIERDGLELG